jgi:hypothetical protein
MHLDSNVPWPTHDERAQVPDTSMLPGSEKARPARGLGMNAPHGLHGSIAGRWAEIARTSVRGQPLVAIAVAAMLGAMMARMLR